jgi:hypothetical protein
MTHQQLQDDASRPVQQYARMATWPSHTPFVFPINHLSIDAEPNANGPTWTKRIRVNAATFSTQQQGISELLNELIQTEICLK